MARKTNIRRMAARRGRAAAPRRGRPAAPRRGRAVARRRGARQMCPAGMVSNAQGQCVSAGGYRRGVSRRGPINAGRRAGRGNIAPKLKSNYRKSGAALIYGGQNLISVGGVKYDCPAGVTYVGGGCVPVSHGFAQTI